MELTSLDLSILMDDFRELEGGHVQKVYQRDKELTVEVYIGGEGKKRLLIGTSYAFLSKYKRDNPTKPPGFAMELRKHLGKLDEVKQRGFDRILELKSGDVKLICEIFGKGNFILVKDGKIIGALRQEQWADRTIEVGEEYVYPDPAPDPREMEDYVEKLEEGEVVRRIASDLSLGGTYAEEICSRADIDKHTEISELSEEEVERINSNIEKIIEGERSPRIYQDEKELRRASPFPLEEYSNLEVEEFDLFSTALDEFFYRREKRKEERKRRKVYQEEKQGLERQKKQMERKIEGLKKSAEQKREDAESIYENYQLLEKLKTEFENAIKEHSWPETRGKIEEAKESEEDHGDIEKIKGMNEQEEFISIDVGDKTLKINLFQDLEATASELYDKAKDSESKIESAKNALKDVEEQLEELGEQDIDLDEVMEDKSEKREKEWFEKYRWFKSSEGHLVLMGRDVQTNEMLVKKHMEKNDLYFHANFDGAPSVVVKDGQDAGEKTRQEAAKAAVTFTKTWKAGIGADDVYYVEPDQVTQEAESGEYLAKGAFVIRGEREYIRNVSVEAGVGSYEIEDDVFVPMCGPIEAVKEHCGNAVEIVPGREKKSDIAKKIRKQFDEKLDLDYIMRSMPPGKSDLK
ncbi:MAG: NFACT family protein [Nanohaloarchaea archaeon]|nr:NFACT family protein [Candidatus Nanohaloarchaea archaeon]